ncbi:biotin--[acetyl-CoA-carboxylase] ligase [Rickettsiaceae bacterium]|nr:biotin--[acetyl-CoA-carboxylase] ligase [Rickettsiaceae bacterium]
MQFAWLKDYNLLTFETIDSTNSEALHLANSGTSGDFVISSRKQTAGRGKKGRAWVSLEGNLHASILLDSKVDPKRHPQLSFVIANAMYDSIVETIRSSNGRSKVSSSDITLKWPNDVLIKGKKLCGILLESIKVRDKNYVVIGFGVNIKASPRDLDYSTTSLNEEGINIEIPDEFLNILMNRFDKLYKQWIIDDNFLSIRENWMKRAYNLNKVVTVDDGVRRVSGIFKEIDFDGAMRIQLASGQICSLSAGDVL